MFENYSACAKRVVSSATTEARQLGHLRVGTEHLLLGLLSEEGSVAAGLLRSAGARIGAARHVVAEVVVVDGESADGEALPFTPRAQRALERAGRFSRQERAAEVTAGHVLLGVLDVEGLACQVLRGLGVDIVRLREAIVTGRADAGAVGREEQRVHDVLRPSCPRCGASLDDTLAETSITARTDAAEERVVSVLYCFACGTALGAQVP